jgi:hypothetical protein
MTARQKAVLIVLGILDIAVIVGLAAVVVSHSRPTTDPGPIVVPDDPCAQELLDALAVPGQSVTVAWRNEAAYVTVSLHNLPSEAFAEQHIWLVLDRLPAPLPQPCPLPESVTLSVSSPQGIIHTVKLKGSDLAAWLAGSHSDADLAARALYRSLHSRPLP